MPNVNTDKAYLLGLILGGGEIVGGRLLITLPYRNWGSLRINPARAGDISEYILKTLRPIWKSVYDLELSYTVENNSWKIYCQADQKLKNDLASLLLPAAGKLKDTADIAALITALDNPEKKKRFIAGLTDTVGSLAKSHRHRVSSNQIISYEFSGKNFKLIADLAGLFDAINCKPDQVLWNHPNFHSGTNRYYNSWRKGFKLRIKLRDYMVRGNFVSEAKKLSAEENMQLQTQTFDDTEARMSTNGRTALHKDESSEWLPADIRGLHFIHYTHLLYCLGAPVSGDALHFLQEKLQAPEKLVTPFTLLTKGTKQEIETIVRHEEYLRKTTYTPKPLNVSELAAALSSADVDHIYGTSTTSGFPKNNVQHAIVYVALAQTNSNRLKGSRVLGSVHDVYRELAPTLSGMNITIKHPDRGTCLVVESEDFAALVGYVDDEFNKRLVSVDAHSLRLKLRNPTYEECVTI